MKAVRSAAAGVILALAAATAQAQPATGYTVVPPSERLTFAGIFADAAPEVQAVMAILVLATLASVALWAIGLPRVGKGDAKGVATALGRLKIIRSAAVPLGFLSASYTLTMGFVGVSNVRPTPSLTVMAPGFAEASAAVVLGLLAAVVAVIGERHLEARLRRAAA